MVRLARTLILAVGLGLLLAGLATSARTASTTAPGAILDQSNPERLAPCGFRGWAPETPNSWAAQTFTASVSGQLTDVVLTLAVHTPQITVALAPVAANGAPLVSVPVASVVLASAESVGRVPINASFSAPPHVEAGLQYAIVLSSATANFDSGVYVAWAADLGSSLNDFVGRACADGAYGGGRAWAMGIDPPGADADFFFETYVLEDKQLVVEKLGTGNGKVADSTGALNCGSTCTSGFSAGSTVLLTATPAPGSTFSGWSGGCTGITLTCSVIVNADKAVTATFKRKLATLVVRTQGNGTVTSKPGGISCGRSCRHQFAPGPVSLVALPARGSHFIGWSGACRGTRHTCRLNLQRPTVVTARFAK